MDFQYLTIFMAILSLFSLKSWETSSTITNYCLCWFNRFRYALVTSSLMANCLWILYTNIPTLVSVYLFNCKLSTLGLNKRSRQLDKITINICLFYLYEQSMHCTFTYSIRVVNEINFNGSKKSEFREIPVFHRMKRT